MGFILQVASATCFTITVQLVKKDHDFFREKKNKKRKEKKRKETFMNNTNTWLPEPSLKGKNVYLPYEKLYLFI